MSTGEDCNKKRSPGRPRILLGITGSVAAVKGPELAVKICCELHADVRVLLTQAGHNFWIKAEEYDPIHWKELHKHLDSETPEEAEERRIQNIRKYECHDPKRWNELKKSLTAEEAEERRIQRIRKYDCHDPKHWNELKKSLTRQESEHGTIQIIHSEDEWKEWNRLGDPVMHIDLREWADIVVIAPLSAHSLAKLANGFCDDTLSCVLRAWDFGHGERRGKPVILAPAMNTAMWQHPLTESQLATFQSFAASDQLIQVVPPQVKTLACGEVGTGALAPVEHIIQEVGDCLRFNM